MDDIIKLPVNLIGKEDRKKLESFGGHTIAHGRATRWLWEKDADGNDVFKIFRGGKHERLTAVIRRNRQLDAFHAYGAAGQLLASGKLEHVFAELDAFFIGLHS